MMSSGSEDFTGILILDSASLRPACVPCRLITNGFAGCQIYGFAILSLFDIQGSRIQGSTVQSSLAQFDFWVRNSRHGPPECPTVSLEGPEPQRCDRLRLSFAICPTSVQTSNFLGKFQVQVHQLYVSSTSSL